MMSFLKGEIAEFYIGGPDHISVSSQHLPYNYQSAMHFNAYRYSSNGKPTIVAKDSSIHLQDLGSAISPNALDLVHLRLLYCGGISIHACTMCT